MTKTQTDEQTDEAEGKKKSKVKVFVPVALVLAVVAYKFVLAPAPATEAAEGEEATTEIEEGEVVPIPELVLNLADPELHYLRAGIALILEKGTSKESIEKELPIASDVAVEVLSAKTFAELREPGAKAAVKEELSTKVREAYDDGKVARVIFTSFVMQ